MDKFAGSDTGREIVDERVLPVDRGPFRLGPGAQRPGDTGLLQRCHQQPEDPGGDNRALSEDLIEQQRKQQEASRALAQESVNAYTDFLDSMFSYYRGSLDEVQRRANQ